MCFDLSDPKTHPLLSAFLPSKSFESLVNVKPWLSSQDPCNLERFEFLERAFRKPCPTSKPKPLSHGFPLVNGVKLRQGCDDGSSVPKLTTPATHGSLHFLQWKFSCRRCALCSVSANKDQVYFSGKPLLEWRSRLKQLPSSPCPIPCSLVSREHLSTNRVNIYNCSILRVLKMGSLIDYLGLSDRDQPSYKRSLGVDDKKTSWGSPLTKETSLVQLP